MLPGADLIHSLFPGSALKNAAILNSYIHQLGALSKDATSAKCIMTDFAISDVIVRWQTYGLAMCFQSGAQGHLQETLQSGRTSQGYGIAKFAAAQAYTIHDYTKYAAFDHGRQDLPLNRYYIWHRAGTIAYNIQQARLAL
jgi:hypothetical protein